MLVVDGLFKVTVTVVGTPFKSVEVNNVTLEGLFELMVIMVVTPFESVEVSNGTLDGLLELIVIVVGTPFEAVEVDKDSTALEVVVLVTEGVGELVVPVCP